MEKSKSFYNLIINPEKALKGKTLGKLPTSKEITKETVRLAWPAVLDSVLAALVSFVDMYMVSGLGTSAITAIGLTNQPKFILLALFFAMNVAINSIIARRFGQGNQKSANACLNQTFVISFGLSMLLGALGFVFANQIMVFSGAESDTIVNATQYFKIISLSILFMAVTTNINAAQRGVGKTRLTMVTNITSNVVNVIFNYFLIGGKCGFPKLGVTGAALATALGSFVAFLIAISSVFKKNGYLRLSIKSLFKFERSTMAPVGRIWLSASVEQLFLRIGFFLFAIIVAKLGTDDFAVHQIGMNVINFSFSIGDGLSVAAGTLIGQYLGKKRSDIALLYGKACHRIGMFFAIILVATFFFGGGAIYSIFSDRAEIVASGARIMKIAGLITALQITNVIYNGALRGAGDTRYVAICMLVSVAILRPLSGYIFAFTFAWGLTGVWLSFLLDQFVRFFFSMLRFKRGKWRNIEL